MEARLGRTTFVMLYVTSGIAGAYTASVLAGTSSLPPIGNVCAVSGVLGAYFVLLPNARDEASLLRWVDEAAERLVRKLT